MIAKSTDGGNTWSQSFVAAPIPAPAQSLPNALYRGGTDVTSTIDLRTGKVVVVYNDNSSGALNVWATHTATAGDLSSFTPAQRVKPSGQTQFFPWLQSAPNGRVDLAYYDRSCDPNDVLNCVTLSSSADSWSHSRRDGTTCRLTSLLICTAGQLWARRRRTPC